MATKVVVGKNAGVVCSSHTGGTMTLDPSKYHSETALTNGYGRPSIWGSLLFTVPINVGAKILWVHKLLNLRPLFTYVS